MTGPVPSLPQSPLPCLAVGLGSKLALVSALAILALTATGCATSVKGSWACAVDRGGVCASIHDIDHASQATGPGSPTLPHPSVLKGAIPARLWGDGGWAPGPIAGAPIRESDPVVKITVAPWIDEAGDYHAGADIFAVMRRASWSVRPPARSQRVELEPIRPERLAPKPAGAAAGSTASPAPAAAQTPTYKIPTGAPS